MSSYSIGMRQKAGIIQAIMENQDLILFDEPTRGLDQESAQKFIELIHNDLKERTVIISAHEGVDRIQFDRKFALINGTLQSI
ncbi:ATP-binding cassette domain-containing protein [Erysipelothrix tonsillarum]|uniref:ATP-binding cassette domain-containing protein n=1 Tax=Erysipelothrix tonsillarum TaxID=38402 RepID=UPI0012E9C9B2|nr:AAA family ATPase [Erysipelothrix tonsillarum]